MAVSFLCATGIPKFPSVIPDRAGGLTLVQLLRPWHWHGCSQNRPSETRQPLFQGAHVSCRILRSVQPLSHRVGSLSQFDEVSPVHSRCSTHIVEWMDLGFSNLDSDRVCAIENTYSGPSSGQLLPPGQLKGVLEGGSLQDWEPAGSSPPPPLPLALLILPL